MASTGATPGSINRDGCREVLGRTAGLVSPRGNLGKHKHGNNQGDIARRPKTGERMTVEADQGEDVTGLSAERDPFIMLPVWMLEASANAIKLYAILRRFADNRTMNAWPGKQTLAEACGYKQAKNVDPALRELEAMGAVVVTRRAGKDGMRLGNHYHVVTTTPRKQAPRQPKPRAGNIGNPVDPEQGLPETSGTPDDGAGNPGIPVGPKQGLPTSGYTPDRGPRTPQTGPHVGPEKGLELRTNKELRTKELEPAETVVSAQSPDELPIDGLPGNVVALSPRSTQQIARAAVIENVAKQAYEDVNRSVAYMGLRKITTWAAGQGYHPDQVSAAFRDLFQNGRAVTQQTVAQYLAGIINSTGRTATASTTDQRVEAGMALADEFRKMEEGK